VCVIDPSLLPALDDLLQDIYESLQPQPVDYEHRNLMVNVFNKIVGEIFGKSFLHIREEVFCTESWGSRIYIHVMCS
jgi:hypothetical protein